MKSKNILFESPDISDSPKPGDRISFVTMGGYVQHILAIRNGQAIVDNTYHKKAPGRILHKAGKTLDFYKKNFAVSVDNLKLIGQMQGKNLWQLIDLKKSIDGKDLKYSTFGLQSFGYVED
jgi:hypothetical protein